MFLDALVLVVIGTLILHFILEAIEPGCGTDTYRRYED